jgi:hypothetical protein
VHELAAQTNRIILSCGHAHKADGAMVLPSLRVWKAMDPNSIVSIFCQRKQCAC